MVKGANDGPLAKRMAKIDQKFKVKETKDSDSEVDETHSGRTCSIEGCDKEAVRSLSKEKFETIVKELNLTVKETKVPRLYICQEHYKLVKKKNKKESKAMRPKFDKKSNARPFNAPHIKRLD